MRASRAGTGRQPAPARGHRAGRPPSGRYTPRQRGDRPSPVWVPTLMLTLLAVGGLVVVLNYLLVLPGSPSPWYGVGAGALAIGGLLVAMRWR